MQTINQIVMMTEGFIALCLGSADRVVWIHQTDAAAFSNDEKIYLPRPCGLEGELELLLGIALREVAKIAHSDSAAFSPMLPDLLGYATAIEDARIKQEISVAYRGAASVFDAATNVMLRINSARIGDGQPDPEMIKHLAIWGAANDAYLGTPISSTAASRFVDLAACCVDPKKLNRATGMAQAAPWLKSTAATAEYAARIQAVFAEPEPAVDQQPTPTPEQGDQEQGSEPQQDPKTEPQDDQKKDQAPTQGQGDPSQDAKAQAGPQSEPQEKANDTDTGQPANDGAASDQSTEADQEQAEAPARERGDPGQEANPQEGQQSEPQEQGNDTDAGQPENDGAPSDQSNGSSSQAGQQNDTSSSAASAAEGEGCGQGSGKSSPTACSDGIQGQGEAQEQDAQVDSGLEQDGKPSPVASAQAGGFSSDPMSNALAMLKGHQGAQPACLPAPSEPHECGQPVNAVLVEALREAMQQPDSMEQIGDLVIAMAQEKPETAPESEATDDEDLLACLIQGSLSSEGYASTDQMTGVNTLGPVPARLVSVLLREFQDKRPKAQLRCQSGRDLSVPHLWRLKAVGDTRVFRKKAPTTGVDAAVMLLLDRSGSMDDDIELAAAATNAFAQALQRISGVQTAISLFPGFETATEEVLKFRQSTIHASARLRAVTADGGTPTGEAILEILPSLMQRPVQKRAIVLITDGEPDSKTETKKAVARAAELGVEVIGIGIGERARIAQIVPRSVTITGIAELPSALESLFKLQLNASLLAA